MKADIAIQLATLDRMSLKNASAETTERAIWFWKEYVVKTTKPYLWGSQG
jgi:hypothetical protein